MTGSMPTEGTGLSRREGPACLSGRRRAESRRHPTGDNNPGLRLISSVLHRDHAHLDLPLLLGLPLQPTRTAKARAMSLQGKPTAPSCRGRDIGHRAMPGSSADRSNDTPLVRTLRIPIRCILVVVGVVPIGDPLPGIAGHIFQPIWGVSVRQRPDRIKCPLVLPFAVEVCPL